MTGQNDGMTFEDIEAHLFGVPLVYTPHAAIRCIYMSLSTPRNI